MLSIENINVEELQKEFTEVSAERIEREIENDITVRKLKNKLKKINETIKAQKNQKEIKEMTITIEWKKSATWGSNPILEAKIQYKDGTYSNTYGKKYTCSGCGYDKESTVIAELFNDYLRYALYNKKDILDNNTKGDRSIVPYGISNHQSYEPHFSGGVGTSCFYKIAEFIGGKLTHTASGKTFDVYTLTME